MPYKVEATRWLGAEVVFCPNDFAQRPVWVERIHREQGKLALSSYDDEETILGNGSVPLEIVKHCRRPERWQCGAEALPGIGRFGFPLGAADAIT